MVEKFCLKWNDFQVNTSKLINVFKQEKSFTDVTLVSDEGRHIPAHRLILSMASEFFNDGLKRMNHPSPMIFLPGFEAKTLSSIIDYIYDGEVQLFQEELDPFLDAAQKLRINGLLSSPVNDEINDNSTIENKNECFKTENEENGKRIHERNTPVRNFPSLDKTIALAINEDAKNAVSNLISKCNDGWKCKECGKTTPTNGQIRLHVEMHIQGLSFPCPFCSESYTSRNSLAKHKSVYHKK